MSGDHPADARPTRGELLNDPAIEETVGDLIACLADDPARRADAGLLIHRLIDQVLAAVAARQRSAR